MQDPIRIAADYLAVWNDADPAERRRRLDAWAPQALYRDPLSVAEGREPIGELIGAVQGRFPGHRFVPRGTPDGYGDFARFSWDLLSPDGTAVAGGTDVARLDGEGRIAEVIGFLDTVAT